MHDEKFIKFIWASLMNIYGRESWVRENGEEPNEFWTEAFNQHSRERIIQTLKICAGFGDTYPINMSQFNGRAKDVRFHEQRMPQLESPKIPKEKQAAYIKKIKAMLAE